MSKHRLQFSVSAVKEKKLSAADFIWRPPPDASSFRTNISPGLEELKGAQRRNVEFLRLAVLAYLTDRTVPRPNRGWARELSLQVPVWDPDVWNGAASDFDDILSFLTNDRWSIAFYRARTPKGESQIQPPQAAIYSLLSGGADSLCGAIRLLSEVDDACFISHADSSRVGNSQNVVVSALEILVGDSVCRWSCWLGRSSEQIGSEEPFGKESTSRSRSLLFVALGLAASSGNEAVLWIPENAYASLNPPLAAERLGALSTRTTHPWYLWRLRQTLQNVGAHHSVVNPFWGLTKGEMFKEVALQIGSPVASSMLSESHSCSRSSLYFSGVKGVAQCGLCFGCLVRRAAFNTAGLQDQTDYLIQDLDAPIGSGNGWLTPGYRVDLETVRYAAKRGVDPAAVLSAPLPPDVEPDEAMDISKRGIAELANFVL